MSGIYLHIPFCKQACSYCDFYFVTRQADKQQFVDELIREIQSKKESAFVSEPVQTIYFGGGTPSQLSPAQVESILKAIEGTFPLQLKEVTFEMNPDDVTKPYLKDLKQAGITRASMGVQSFDTGLLAFMHRAHTAEEALACLRLLRESDLEEFTVDLIYGNPGQTLEMLKKDIETILKFNPPHVSAYSLTIEPKTRLGKQFTMGKLIVPEDDIVAQHFDLVAELLQQAGILQYEVSNYAKPGSEAVHNSNYWEHVNYLGFGPGAHSFWWDVDGQTAKRWSNEPNLRNYLGRQWITPHEKETLTLPILAEERLMLALRTRKGISLDELEMRYKFIFNQAQKAFLCRLKEEGKVFINEKISLTQKGLKIADSILIDLLVKT